jgi:hypothetical protein
VKKFSCLKERKKEAKKERNLRKGEAYGKCHS